VADDAAMLASDENAEAEAALFHTLLAHLQAAL